MALTELTSNLSKFRKPLQTEPLSASPTPNLKSAYSPTPQSIKTPYSPNKNFNVVDNTNIKSPVTIRQMKPIAVKEGVSISRVSTESIHTKSPVSITKTATPEKESPVSINQPVAEIQYKSSLDIDTPVKYRIRDVQDNSNLNIDSAPARYQPNNNIVDQASNLEINSIPERYIDRRSFSIYSGGVRPSLSSLDIDSIPAEYSNVIGSGRFISLNANSSALDIDSIPSKYLQIVGAGQFVPFRANTSLLDINTIPNSYISTVGTGQFDPRRNTISNLDIDSIPVTYISTVGTGQFDPRRNSISNLDIDSRPITYISTVGTGQFDPRNNSLSNLDIDTTPTSYQSVVGTGQFDPRRNSLSNLDIDSRPTSYISIVGSGQFSPFSSTNSILDLNSTPNKYISIVGPGQFSNDATIVGSRWSGTTPPAVNYFSPDLSQGAKGFTVRFTNRNESQFLGISGNTYAYTDTIVVDNKTINSQLGIGSSFKYTDNGIVKFKTFSPIGYSAKNRYELNSNSTNSPLLNRSIEENSPSALDLQYSKFNLQDSSYNPYYLKQPYIVRGIQRPGKTDPQYWGGHPLADDGFIQGGMAAAVERSAVDVGRLTQWLASPKGLLWAARQTGAGLMNPRVETPGPVPLGLTRVHAPLNTLLTAGINAFGIRLTKHGSPQSAVNEQFKYGTVADSKKATWELNNRLISLKRETQSLPVGSYIPSLTYFGGPNSAYGIGFTTAMKYENGNEVEVSNKFNIAQSYAAVIGGKNSAVNIQVTPAIKKDSVAVDATDDSLKSKVFKDNKLEFKPTWPDSDEAVLEKTGTQPPRRFKSTIYDRLIEYAKNSGNTDRFNTFTEEFSPTETQTFVNTTSNYTEVNLTKTYGWGTHGSINADRSNPSIVHDEFNTSKSRGDKVNLVDYKTVELTDPIAVGDYTAPALGTPEARDFIAFYFAGPKHVKNYPSGDGVMIFRANIVGFNDSFTPQWNAIDIMGRADKSYLYTGFERSISFTFTVAATSRDEMKPIWRKLNYLASYTMPDYKEGRMVGPYMRLTIGNLFQNTPGFLESLSITIPDEATWELGPYSNEDMYQLPMMVEVSVGFKVIGDWRPRKLDRVYSLSKLGQENNANNWIPKPPE